MNAFLHGMGLISAQETFNKASLDDVTVHTTNKLLCIEPDYTNWIDPKSIRRMSKIIRMGVAAAKLALQQAKLGKPDAIITGTGLGCLEDTEIFLNKLIDNKEEALNPTPFIQSTHNTIGSQVALLTQCLGYNQTYTHRAFSFELVLEDALMLLNENPYQNILVGCADEVTDLSTKVFQKFGWDVRHSEGAGYFLLNSQKQDAIAELAGVRMIFKPQHSKDLIQKIQELLSSADLKTDDVDLILSGECGDEKYDSLLKEVLTVTGFADRSISYKDLSGEYSTASSFAVWLACTILATKRIPAAISTFQKPVRNVLIYNQYFNQHHTLILLKAC